MHSARAWAALNGFDYRFIDDGFLECVPAWFRDKARHICPVTDLARLLTARNLLTNGYERAIWIDADIVVFAPERLTINDNEDCLLAAEVWFSRISSGQTAYSHRVNNSISVFKRGSVQLEFLIHAAERIARLSPTIGKLDIGTQLLSQLHRLVPFPLLENVGMFSPLIMKDMATGQDEHLDAYTRHLSAPLACANLCMSLQGMRVPSIVVDDELCMRVVDRCLESGGEVVNRFVTGRHQASMRLQIA